MTFPDSIPVKIIDAKHPEWTLRFNHWETLRKLYEGGQTIEEAAAEFLPRRSMEPQDQYNDRLTRFAYHNHVNNIVGWFTAALYKNPPDVTLRKQGVEGEEAILKPDDASAAELIQFQNDVDGTGSSIVKHFRENCSPKLLIYRKCYTLFDLPKASEPFQSLGTQKAAGALRPHLVTYNPQDVTNWIVDESGNFDWIVIKLRQITQATPFVRRTYSDLWYVYTRTEVAVYRFDWPLPNNSDDSGVESLPNFKDYGTNASATRVSQNPHALSDQNRVPVFLQELSAEHWIGDRLKSPLCRLLAKENEYDWSLEQSALAWLVLYSDKEVNAIKRSEVAFLQLGTGDKAQYLVPDGSAYKAMEERIIELREDAYRLAYLVAQGRSSRASATVQSGVSKEQDMLPARDVLSALGDQAIRAMQLLLQTASNRMELPIDVDVQGMNFADRTDMIELEVMQRAETIDEIPSERFQKERQKRLVRFALPDLNREVLADIDNEIETAVVEQPQAQQQEQQAVSQRLAQFTRDASSRLYVDAEAAA